MYQFPECRKCGEGDLVPFSDFGSQGAPIHYKAWVCTNPDCGYNIKIRNGELFIDEPINDGQMHLSRGNFEPVHEFTARTRRRGRGLRCIFEAHGEEADMEA